MHLTIHICMYVCIVDITWCIHWGVAFVGCYCCWCQTQTREKNKNNVRVTSAKWILIFIVFYCILLQQLTFCHVRIRIWWFPYALCIFQVFINFCFISFFIVFFFSKLYQAYLPLDQLKADFEGSLLTSTVLSMYCNFFYCVIICKYK